METEKIYILNTINRSSALIEQKWSHISLLHMKINGIIEKGAGHFFIEQGFCLIKMIEARHKWGRVILTSPW